MLNRFLDKIRIMSKKQRLLLVGTVFMSGCCFLSLLSAIFLPFYIAAGVACLCLFAVLGLFSLACLEKRVSIRNLLPYSVSGSIIFLLCGIVCFVFKF
jgi:hypothetical protein